MKEIIKAITCIFILFSFILFNSCNTGTSDSSTGNSDNQNDNKTDNNSSSNDNEYNTNNTVRVYLQAGPSNVTYTFIDTEGDAYKQGTLLSGEIITINHCKKGQYNIQFKVGGYVATYNIINITSCCTLYFGNPNTITITENNTESNIISASENVTYNVVLNANPFSANYTFINDEGDCYKQGKLLAGQVITISHFKAGTYHLQFKVGSYVPAFNVISITNNCSVTFNDPLNVTIN